MVDSARIMVVEDEGIIAQDIKNCLENLGYTVPGVAFTGQDAILKAEQTLPDLVLMDIVLKGDMDGIETATEIRSKFNIPIVYLTAYEDDKTLNRAKITEPLGYILKPFEERYLRSSIEMALYKHKMERKLKENEQWLSTILKSVTDAVIVTDIHCKITYMNSKAELLTGWSTQKSLGKIITEVVRFINEETRFPIDNPVEKVLKENVILSRSNNTILVSNEGIEFTIDHSASPIRNEHGQITGVVLVIHDVSEKKVAQVALRESEKRYRDLFDYATDAIFVFSLSGDILSVNNEVCSMFHYSREEIYSLKFSNLIAPNELDFASITSELKSKESTHITSNFIRKDKEIILIEASFRLIKLQDEEVIQVFARNITDKKHIESEALVLAQAIKNINECISITDLDNRITFVNDSFCRTYGYTREELIGKKMNIVRSLKNSEELYDQITAATLKGSWTGELLNRSRDGREFPVELTTSVICDADGNAINFIGIASDISERKLLEKALRESEKEYRNLFENAHDAILIYRPQDGIILDVNQRACEIYGFSSIEFIGMSLELIAKGNGNAIKALSELREVGDSSHFETTHVKKDGTRMFLDVNIRLINYRGEKTIASVNRDITDRKKSIEALLLSEKRYQDLYDSAPDMYFIVGLDGTIKSVNRFGAEHLGYRKDELLGREIWTVVHPDDLKLVKQKIKYIFQHKLENEDLDFRKVKKDGTIIWVLERTRLIFNERNEPTELFIICRDVTNRKQVESALIESEEKYRNLTQNAPLTIGRISLSNNKYEFVNKEFESLFGYNIQELNNLGSRNLLNLAYQEDRDKVSKVFNDWEDSGFRGTKQLEYRVFTKDRKLIWIDSFLYADLDINGKATALNQICVDITERKRTQETATESEKKFKELADNAPICITKFSTHDYKYVFVNDQFTKITGYTLDEYNNLSVEEIKALAYQGDYQQVHSFLEDWKRSGYEGKHKLTYRIYNKQKEILWLENYLWADFNSEDEAVFVNQLLIDITERKKAEQVIETSEKKYRKLAESAPIAVTRMSLETNQYEFVNDEFVRQSGYSREEFNLLSEQILVEMIHPEDRERIFGFYNDWSKSKYQGIQHLDYRIINKDKELLWLDTFLYADFDDTGKAIALNQICIDVTRQRTTLEALDESQSRFRALIENSNDMIELIDSSGKITFASTSVTKILGYKTESITGKNLYEMIYPEDLSKVKAFFNEVVSKRGKPLTAQYRHRHFNNSWVWIECTASNLLEESGIKSIVFNFRDIAERRRYEQELILQKSYFQQLFENSPEGIVMLDNSDCVVNANKSFEKMFQFSVSEISGKKLNDLIVPENLTDQGLQMTNLVLQGDALHKETMRRRKDGTIVEVSIIAYPISLGNDQIGVYGIYSDITERKEKDKALQTSEERYKAFVKQSTEGIWRMEVLEPISTSLNVAEQIKMFYKYAYLAECNDVFAIMYGYSEASQIIGTKLSDMLIETEQKNIEYLSNFISSGYRLDNAESIERDKNNRNRYFLNNLVGIIENGNLVRAWGTQRDITDAKIAQEELIQTQFRLATLLNNMPDVVLYETGANREFISENVVNLLGYPASKFMEDREFFPKLVHPVDKKLMDDNNTEWQKKNRPGILIQQFRCRKANGIYIWIEDHMVNVTGEDGVSRMAGVLIDVNESKKAEEKLKQLADKLAESNRELEQFAYVASHDLQEPLRMVASYIQLLQRRYKDRLGSEADEFIGFAVDGVVRMKALINDLLVYSRVNTQDVVLEDINMNTILKSVLTNLNSSIEENNANIIYDELPTVKGIKLQMTQVLQNLISNAIKFHGDKPPEVRIIARKETDEWLFSISDNGIGIEKDFTDRIFVIFQRLHNYSEYKGTGIGLAICKKIIEKLGGHIWVESEPGKGSTFYFTVPFVNGEV